MVSLMGQETQGGPLASPGVAAAVSFLRKACSGIEGGSEDNIHEPSIRPGDPNAMWVAQPLWEKMWCEDLRRQMQMQLGEGSSWKRFPPPGRTRPLRQSTLLWLVA